jgi:hypothetical protein
VKEEKLWLEMWKVLFVLLLGLVFDMAKHCVAFLALLRSFYTIPTTSRSCKFISFLLLTG